MNRDDITRMALEAGDDWEHTLPEDKAFLERFAALVAAAEREREHKWMSDMLEAVSLPVETLQFIRDVIRARGEK